MQRQDVQHDQCEQHDGQCHHVQGKETVERYARKQIIATDPRCDVLTHHRDRTEQ